MNQLLLADYNFIPFKAYTSQSGRKITRKHVLSDLWQMTIFFPAEGHIVVDLQPPAINRQRGDYPYSKTPSFLGGSKRGEDASWETPSAKPMLINLSIEEDDVNFTSIENVSTAGSRVSPLQCPAVVFLMKKLFFGVA